LEPWPAALLQVGDDRAPCRLGLRRRETQAQQAFLPRGGDPERGEDGHRDDAARQAHFEVKAIEEDDRIPLGREIAALPRGKERFQTADDPRHRAPRQMALAQQRREGRAHPPAVDAAQITAENRLIDLAGPPSVSREQSAPKLGRRAIVADHSTAGDRERPRTLAGRHGALTRPVAVPSPVIGAFMPMRSQRGGDLLGERDLKGLADVVTKLGFDVLTKLKNARATLRHGVILRRRC